MPKWALVFLRDGNLQGSEKTIFTRLLWADRTAECNLLQIRATRFGWQDLQ